MEQDFSKPDVIVGRVLNPHGVRGDFKVEVISDFPGRFSTGEILYLDGQQRRIQRCAPAQKNMIILKLEGINTPGEAEMLKNKFLTVPQNLVPALPEGQYYHFQIIGMGVYTQDGEDLGCITQIIPTGSNDVYVVYRNGRELLIPALDDVIKKVDIAAEVMIVELPEGLR